MRFGDGLGSSPIDANMIAMSSAASATSGYARFDWLKKDSGGRS